MLNEVALDLDASIGIVAYPDHGSDAAELLQHADVAMYLAKLAHVGSLVYDPSVDQHSPKRLALLGGLRLALERDELLLHYQPKTDLRSGDISGVEALVRWQHPEHSLLGPGEFIPLTERTGLIHPLTRAVLDAALDPTFPDQVAGQLAGWEVPPHLLVLEITESAVMADRSFVSQMATSPRDAVIVRSTIDLGHNLGLRVVAEGVETRQALEALAALGCDLAQGYHLGRPMPAADLERHFRSVQR
jgi:EAL domain-containing protein (putative c-di-GMP-specific phosphodiesterase class I)